MSSNKPSLDALKIDRGDEEFSPGSGSRLGLWIVLVVFLLAGAGWGAWYVLGKSVVVGRSALVQGSDGDRGSGSSTVLNGSGYVVARREATVSSKVTGKVVEVLIEEGMEVEEGRVLARLDAKNVEVNLELVLAQLEVSKQSLGETDALLEEARLDFDRQVALTDRGISSRADRDRATAQFHQLQARKARQMGEIVVAERQVDLWRQQIEDTVIRAPFSGKVVTKNAQPGEMISPVSAGGGFTRTGICTIVDMESLEIEVDVSENYINRVFSGQPVTATLNAYSDWLIPAHVIAIIPTADRQKSTVKVRVGFRELDSRILPQMGVKVAFQQEASKEEGKVEVPTVRVPATAIKTLEGQSVAWVIQGERLERRAVKVLRRQGSEVWVSAGLRVGEKVLIEGLDQANEGAIFREQQ